MLDHPQRQYMQRAIEEAKSSAMAGQYALGSAVINQGGEVVAVAHTTLHETNDPTAHAEVNAIRLACARLGSRYLAGCWLYTTLEPCPMCTAAAIWAKMEGIVFGASQGDAEAFAKGNPSETFTWRQIKLPSKDVIERGEPRLKLIEGFMGDECRELLKLK